MSGFHRERPVDIDNALRLLGPLASRRAAAHVHLTDRRSVDGMSIGDALQDHAALALHDSVAPDVIDRWTRAIDGLGPNVGVPFSPGRLLGGGWFAYASAIADPVERSIVYQQDSAAGAAVVAQVMPDLASTCMQLTENLLRESVSPRPDFFGPGVVIFEGESAVGADGDIHLDWEGLISDELFAEAYTFVLMVRPAHSGGDLRVWGVGASDADIPAVEVHSSTCVGYRAGTLVVFPSTDLHQITAMDLEQSRITVNWHVRRHQGNWQLWF